ncbi:hypothetical protein AB0F30_16700 [Streptomyces sp. NPDC029006]|uniref:hypothetical protein n=1 Tax=Streptomyces sp. NPDC029006 TaxID=3155467 RepID=UPI003409A165
MIRRYLPALISSVLYIGFGIGIGLLWIAATGRREMPPWWMAVLLAAGAAWIADLAEQALRRRHHRRQRTAHRTHARPRPTTRKAA